ncbi:MAG: Veg family protein [Clostridia bacterium]|nr:Veg family protein [Clostridia bacterium]
MIKAKGSISDVKRMINAYAQQHVALKVNLGRNRTQQFSGVLSGVYPMLFTIQPDDKDFLGKKTFSYGDVLCGTVKIKRLPE